IAGHVYAPLDMAAALAAITSILTGRGITSAPLPPAPAPAPSNPPPRDQPLTQESLWDRLSEALTPNNVVLADQGTSFYGMAGHRLASGATFIGQPLWGSIGYTLPAALGAGLAPRRRPAGRSCPPAWRCRAAVAARPPSGCTPCVMVSPGNALRAPARAGPGGSPPMPARRRPTSPRPPPARPAGGSPNKPPR